MIGWFIHASTAHAAEGLDLALREQGEVALGKLESLVELRVAIGAALLGNFSAAFRERALGGFKIGEQRIEPARAELGAMVG